MITVIASLDKGTGDPIPISSPVSRGRSLRAAFASALAFSSDTAPFPCTAAEAAETALEQGAKKAIVIARQDKVNVYGSPR